MKNLLQISAFLIFFQISGVNASSQNKVIPTFSCGYIHHLGRSGVNFELGGEYEILKHLGVSANYRYSLLSRQSKDKIKINAMAINLSWIVINTNRNRLSISTGLTAGNYYSLSNNWMNLYNPRFEKDYYAIWWNPFKIQYDYTFSNKAMVGTYLSFYGDDGDNSNSIGIVIGYKL